MLSTLHHAVEHLHPWWQFWHHAIHPVFRLEIVASGGRIRFFLSTDAAYASFLTSQIYAHYSDVELIEAESSLPKKAAYRVRDVALAHNSLDTLKLYANLKDRTEKESIDPLSSLTSALSKVPKNGI